MPPGVGQAAGGRLAHTAGADPGGVVTSDLSESDYVLLGAAGFEPLGFVVDSSSYHIGLQLSRYQVRYSTDTDLYLSNEYARYTTTPFDPYSVWTQPFSPQTNAETKYCGSPIPGTTENPGYFDETEYENFKNSYSSAKPSDQQQNLSCASDGYNVSNCASNAFNTYSS
jgi:hypothetical protein